MQGLAGHTETFGFYSMYQLLRDFKQESFLIQYTFWSLWLLKRTREKVGLSEVCCRGLGERCWWAALGQQVQKKEANGCEIYLGAEYTVFTDKSREREARQEWCLGSGLSTDRNVIPFIDREKMGVEASVLDVRSSRCLWASWEKIPRAAGCLRLLSDER